MTIPSAPIASVSPSERTQFAADLTIFDAVTAELQPLINKAWRHCEKTGNRRRRVTLKVKFFDFKIITRADRS